MLRFIGNHRFPRLFGISTFIAQAAVFCAAVHPQCLLAQTYVNQWAWMGGDVAGASGVYGELGHFSPANRPGARQYAANWTDKSGRFWLYGGTGSDSNYNHGDLDDLWVFDPLRGPYGEWAWMGGNDKVLCTGCGRPGNYGTQGEFTATNNPGSRARSTAWTDARGKLWLFGGGYTKVFNPGTEYASFVEASLNDVWEFDPALGVRGEWAWIGGSNSLPSGCGLGVCGQPGVYGVRGEFAPENTPGAREGAASAVGQDGTVWLFGGAGYDGQETNGSLNDLWRFDPNQGTWGEWAWISGSGTVGGPGTGRPGVAGDRGTFAAENTPASRDEASMRMDRKGHLWLFGGYGLDLSGHVQEWNDLWAFDPSMGSVGEWAWVAGSNKLGESGSVPGVYGQEGHFDSSNTPGSRYGAQSWMGRDGAFWLFGGQAHDSTGAMGDLNDLWQFNSTLGAYGEWAWMGGSSTLQAKAAGQPGSFGLLGQFSSSNEPGGRDNGTVWLDLDGNVWLFGGGGYLANLGEAGRLNDLWEYKRLIVQRIEWQSVPSSVVFNATPIKLSATGGSSGKPVFFNVLSGPGKVSGSNGSMLTMTDVGTIVVAANEAGNSEYAAAPQVAHSIVVKPADTVATPLIKPGTGTFKGSQWVTISDSTSGVEIYYTTDGSIPSATHGKRYSAPIDMTMSETLKAIGVKAGYTASAVATAAFTIN